MRVDIYTDGACSGNPGKGGWGAVLVYGNTEKEISGGNSDTTNNSESRKRIYVERRKAWNWDRLYKSIITVNQFSDTH